MRMLIDAPSCNSIYAHTYFNVGVLLTLQYVIYSDKLAAHHSPSINIITTARELEWLVAQINISCQTATRLIVTDLVESSNRSVGARILNFIHRILMK